MPFVLYWMRGRCWLSAPTGSSPPSTPFSASTPPSPAAPSTANIPGGWVPEQKITVAEALRAYTWGSAYASFEEKIKGTIEPGKLADLAVLARDILTIDAVEIEKVKVALTVVDGKIVYRARQ
jgi:predicted amidohydrolase YtcJ